MRVRTYEKTAHLCTCVVWTIVKSFICEYPGPIRARNPANVVYSRIDFSSPESEFTGRSKRHSIQKKFFEFSGVFSLRYFEHFLASRLILSAETLSNDTPLCRTSLLYPTEAILLVSNLAPHS